MAAKTVKGYFVRHRIGDANTFLTLYFDGGGSEVINNLDISHAAYMIDLLRNEAPITYEITEKILATASQEPVGEGE